MPEGASRGQAEHAALHLGFDDPASVAVWSPVDDVVMGGLSNSRLVHSGGHAEFTGSVSLANNGGFASVRTAALDYSAPGAEEVRVCARGDGRTYRLTLRTDDAPDGISWHAARFSQAMDDTALGDVRQIATAPSRVLGSMQGAVGTTGTITTGWGVVNLPAVDPGIASKIRLGLSVLIGLWAIRLSVRWLTAATNMRVGNDEHTG